MRHHNSPAADLPSDLAHLIMAAEEHLTALGYRPDTRGQYRKAWDALQQYAQEVIGTDQYSESLAEAFLASVGLSPTQPMKTLTFGPKYCLRAIRVLGEFRLHGCFHRWRPNALRPLPPAFQSVASAYEAHCRQAGIRQRTMHTRSQLIRKLVEFLGTRGITEIAGLDAAVVSDFIAAQCRYNANTVCLLVRNLRLFLRYLHQADYHAQDLSPSLPRVPGRYRDLLPTTWSRDEIARLLACVDRDSPKGKRDYAVLLLAARLGLRTSDIVTLRLEHIHWDAGRIQKVQSKTGVLLDVPLLEDVGRALIDYLQHSRPDSTYREVFLRCVVPIQPFDTNAGLANIIDGYRRRAGIAAPPESRRGMHALRHAVASHLLECGTPLPVISGVLGHLDADSTRVYTKIDVDQLRRCALDAVEVPHA
jgi:site-specific recombinase XerD